MSMTVVRDVVAQHAEEAAFLWLLRDHAVRAPHYTLQDICALDERLEAHLDGLRIAGETGLEICMAAFEQGGPGETFPAALLSLERDEGGRFARLVERAHDSRDRRRALVSSLGWVAAECARRWIDVMLRAPSSAYQQVGIAAVAVNREDPGDALSVLIERGDVATIRRCLKAAGELKRRALRDRVVSHLCHEDPNVRLWSSWSGALLREQSALQHLETVVDSRSAAAIEPPLLQLAFRLMDPRHAAGRIKALAHGSNRRDAIVGCGVAGDPLYVPWLIRQMEIPQHARAAGEAFTMITGVDLALEDLEGEWPEGFEAGPTESADDDDVQLDPDEDLPWPEPTLIKGWWDEHGSAFHTGTRHLCGRPITDAHCRHVLRQGYQRQRIAAAYELALMNPQEPLFEWRAPGFRQQERLGWEASTRPRTRITGR